MFNLDFFKDKRVFITGHTGFKGTWLSKILIDAGSDVCGYSLEAPTQPSLFEMSNIKQKMKSHIGDIRNYDELFSVMKEFQPEIVFHLAAQPIVTESYKLPRYTFETNVMGTVNVLDCINAISSVKSAVIITTDKVYENKEWLWGYREDERLNGYDPYSNSKSCADLATGCYVRSFLKDKVPVTTMRAGNVIGGGDFAKDRIIPDCIRAAEKGQDIAIRNPNSVRPYQHVLEPLFAYMFIAAQQYNNPSLSSSYNIGPDDSSCVTTGELADMFCSCWGNIKWESNAPKNAPHEAKFLKLDCSKLKSLGWRPVWSVNTTIDKICCFHKGLLAGEKVSDLMEKDIRDYIFDSTVVNKR